MERDLLLGLDLGTTRCKALLLDRSGTEVNVASAPTPFLAGGPRIEMTVAALVEATIGLVAQLGPDVARVSGVGIAGMAECGAPLDEHAMPMAAIIAWHDPRGEDVVADLAIRFGDALALRTGQGLRSVSSVAKLGWLVRHGAGPVTRWLGVPELCLNALTGAEATEHSLASRTGCYDVLEQRWLPEVAQAAGFPAQALPIVLAAGTRMGSITPQAGDAWGLPAGAPVTLAGHDHLSGAVGAGSLAGDLVNSVGTAETVLGRVEHAPDLAVALQQRTPVSVAPGGTGWVILGGAARSGVILAAASHLLGRSLSELDALAVRGAGSATPPMDHLLADLQSGLAVILPAEPPGAVWRGILRALAARTAETAQRVAELAPAQRMLVIGGGSRSQPWLAEKASAVPLPLAVPATQQAAARGAAVQAGVAAGWWTTAAGAPAPDLGDPLNAPLRRDPPAR